MGDDVWVDLDEVANIVHLATLNGDTPNEPADSWTPINLALLPDAPPVQPDLADTGLIYPGKRHVFSGPPESAKTLAAYAILIQVARHGHHVILIDFEMGAYDARGRLYELGASRDELAAIHYLEPTDVATRDRIDVLLGLHPALLVIDAAAGAYALEGFDDNKRADVEKLARLYVTPFWQAGITSIFIDHVVKDKEQRGKFSIGSERKLGGADVHLGFEPVKAISRGNSGLYKIITHKDRGGYLKRGHLADLHLDSDPDTHQITWRFTDPETSTDAEGYFRPTHLMEKVSINLENRLEPVARNTVYEELGGTKDYVLKAISALVREGFVTETAGPNRSKLLAWKRRYRENDAECNPKNGSTMPAEPLEPLSEQATEAEKRDLAQPSGGSVVRQWFGSGSPNHPASGGSVVRPPYGDDTTRPPAPDHPETSKWFDWLESVRPDDEEDLDTND